MGAGVAIGQAFPQRVEVGYVTDPAEIAAAGVMGMPALAVDGRVVSTGRVLKADQVTRFL